MGTITGQVHQNPLKTVEGVAETSLTAEKLLKGHNSVFFVLLFYVHGKHLRSCRDGQLT